MRRWLTRILVCLVLGAVTTVGVAWGFALYIQSDAAARVAERGWRTRAREDAPSQMASFGHYQEPGCEFVVTSWLSYPDADPTWRPSFSALPTWASMRRPVPFSDVSDIAQQHDLQFAYGWPIVALSFQLEWRIQPPSGGLQTPLTGDRLLPVSPGWPGFVIDTVIFGFLWFALIFGYGTVRFVTRKRRGHCLRCGYDLRGCKDPGCPECGWNRRDDQPPGKSVD